MTPTEPTAPLPPTTGTATRPRPRGWFIPWLVLAIAAIYVLSVIGRMNPPSKPFNLESLARLPVIDGGRMKPLETVARVNLRMISQRETFVDDAGDTQPAIRWYLDVIASGSKEAHGKAWKYRVFRIENDQLLAELGLKPREGLRYSLDEIAPQIGKLDARARTAFRKKMDKKPMDLLEVKLLELSERLELFFNLANLTSPLMVPPQSPGEEWNSIGRLRADSRKAALVAVLKPTQEQLAVPERFAKITADQRNELLIRLGGYVTPPMDPAVVDRILLGFLSEKPDALSGNDLAERLITLGEIMTEQENATLLSLASAAESQGFAQNAAAQQWLKMIETFQASKPDEFNTALQEYRDKYLTQVSSYDITKTSAEAYYNRFAPFYICTALYVLVFTLCALSWLGMTEPLRKSAFYLLYFTLIIHTAALIARMYFQDRWSVFVTNLYSSAVFIGWGCVVMGLILEKLYPIGIGNTVAAVLGVGTAIISHNLGAGGDTLEMMQAVLDTNFWLSTHVTTVTFGYTATFVAGFIGAAYIARMLATIIRNSFQEPGKASPADLLVFSLAAFGLTAIPVMLVGIGLNSAADFEVIPRFIADILTFLVIAAGTVYALVLLFARASTENLDAQGHPITGTVPVVARAMNNLALDADASKKLTQMIYGVVCFATLLSFVGTVLGGIWADQSWGRFWGWDPKENGAVLIVLWNALILHARWAGLVRDRGLAVLAVVGNMITAWSWFGTNQLGIGLHNYGFDSRLAKGCRYFWLSQTAIIALGLLPRSYWGSSLKAIRGTAVAPLASGTPGSVVQSPVPNLSAANESHARQTKNKKNGKKR